MKTEEDDLIFLPGFSTWQNSRHRRWYLGLQGRVLGGSWDLVSSVISTLIGGISSYNCSYLTYNPNY